MTTNFIMAHYQVADFWSWSREVDVVAIDHRGGLSTLYCHLSQIFIGLGQDVERGQAIGSAGMTGDATGPHVHFQVMHDGRPVDPMSYLR